MQVKRFVAADMRRALEMVRQDLGPDAIILSSNRTADGVELLTTMGTDSELAQLQQQPLGRLNMQSSAPLLSDGEFVDGLAKTRVPASEFTSRATPVSETTGTSSGKARVDEIERARQKLLMAKKAEESAKELLVGKNTRVNAAIPRSAASAPVQTNHSTKPFVSAADRYPLIDKEISDAQTFNGDQSQLADLQAEIADMRYLLEQQLAQLTSGTIQRNDSPLAASLIRRLERLGLPQEVITKAIKQIKPHKTLSDAWPDVLATLAHQLPVRGGDVVDKGGIFAFVGPTGVGKTTTIGKLAARYVLNHGADKVALITTDTYRIAAHDQLRSLARILRVPVRVVNETQSLESLLKSLRHCSLILIDTAGFRHGDPALKSQLESLAALRQINTYLVMSTNSQAQMLKASVHAYGVANLKGCVLTKLDETASMGEALGVAMQSNLPVAYTTDGQDIPKNIEVAKAHQLITKAVSLLKANSVSILNSH